MCHGEDFLHASFGRPTQGRRTAKGRKQLQFLAYFLVGLSAMGGSSARRDGLIIARALSYDYRLKSRAGDAIEMAVIYKPGNRSSEDMATEMAKEFKSLEAVKIQDLPFRVIRLAYERSEALQKSIEAEGIDVIYVCEGLEKELPSIKEISRSKKVMTIGNKEEFVKSGLSLGVFRGEEQYRIVVNLAAAKAEGVEFAAELLRLAEVIK